MNSNYVEKKISLLREGSYDAFEGIYKSYSNGLYALALQYLKSTVLADDALQYVFMKLWENRTLVDAEQNLQNYLFTIMKNYLINTLKAENNQTERYLMVMKEALSSGTSALEEKIIFEERLSNVCRLIKELPVQKKLICEMKLSGHSNRSIADKLKITENTVKSHYQTALNLIRNKIIFTK